MAKKKIGNKKKSTKAKRSVKAKKSTKAKTKSVKSIVTGVPSIVDAKEMKIQNFKTTEEIEIPKRVIDQVIGQEKAVEIIEKAAKQRRNVLLIGSPGTGKSMLALGMAELMPAEQLQDILMYPNNFDENNPKVRSVKTYPTGIPQNTGKEEDMMGQGRKILFSMKTRAKTVTRGRSPLIWIFLVLIIGLIIFQFAGSDIGPFFEKYSTIIAAVILGGLFLGAIYMFSSKLQAGMMKKENLGEPKLIVDNTGRRVAPFIEATGAKAGALFGDVRHDPLQSGGLGTPPHLRVESGSVHRANKGVLFIDEVGTISPRSQQDLLTAMQEKKFPITGQSEMSSGALTRTEPVPCDFVLVAAGNLHDIQHMHPALRSRIRGYGYEIYLSDTILDNEVNRNKLVRFVAQEVRKDGKIPHFTRDAVEAIIREARKLAGRKNRLTLRLRGLGGIIRAAGDIAVEEKARYVTEKHVAMAKKISGPIEQQLARQMIEIKKEYSVLETSGHKIGRVNGLAVIGDENSGLSGLIMPIVAEVTPASSKFEGKVIATGKLGEIAREAVSNVSAILKKHMKKDVTSFDTHIQFLQSYDGIEGDSASVSVALAVLSAMEGLKIAQNTAMTGSLSVRGQVLPVGGVTAKVEAAIEAGMKRVIVPAANVQDIVLSKEMADKIEIIPVYTITDVIEAAVEDGKKKSKIIKDLKKELK